MHVQNTQATLSFLFEFVKVIDVFLQVAVFLKIELKVLLLIMCIQQEINFAHSLKKLGTEAVNLVP